MGLAVAVGTATLPAFAPSVAPPPRTVIAVMGEAGLNVLHDDFLLAEAEREQFALPTGAADAERVSLPVAGSFEHRLDEARSGPLGRLDVGSLTYVEGTRVLVHVPVDELREDEPPYDLLEDRLHGTGVVSAAIGSEYGTSPDSLVVFVPGATRSGWEWVAEQDWIDLVTVSSFELVRGGDLVNQTPSDRTCPEQESVARIVDSGRIVFASAGNATQESFYGSPNGLADVYQVGGVDGDGRTVFTPQDDPDPFFAVPVTTRPYETGDDYDFEAASSDALSGPMQFGGTSGASPRTTGRAASLLATARRLLGTTVGGVRGGALARLDGDRSSPPAGPLADGSLRARELTDLLHDVAVPFEPATPGRYALEGYGALNGAAMAHADEVLRGVAEVQERPDDDAAHDLFESARRTWFDEARCQ